MPDINTYWRTDRPEEGFYSTVLPTHPDRPVRTFLPSDYQHRYPYPLVVLFHGHGGSEEQAARLAPRVSRRNYITISLRGPRDLGRRADGRPAFGWGADDGTEDGLIEDYVLRAVEQTRRTYHVHSERVYLAGVCEGAAVAYRLGLAMPDRVAGIIALNGYIPRPTGAPLFRFGAVRSLAVLIGHGTDNPVVPYAAAQKDYRLLYAAGADVRMVPYPTTHKLHPHMLRDMNRWIMSNVNAETDALVDVEP
jgi:phospholipase/carboxylesterase